MPENAEHKVVHHTPETLHAALKELGWKFAAALKETGVSWYAYRSIPNEDAAQDDDKRLQIVITPYLIDKPGFSYNSVQFEIRGTLALERPIMMMTYSFSFDEAIDAIEPSSAILRAAFNAAKREVEKYASQ